MFAVNLRRLFVSFGIVFALAGIGWGLMPAAASALPMSQVAAASDVSKQPIGTQIVVRAKASWPWYVTRGSGLIAAILMAMLMLSGVGMLTGYTYRFLEPLTAWTSHRAMGFAFAASVLVHMVALLFDKFAPFTVPQLLVPFLSHYKPVTLGGHNLGSLNVALGVFAFYAIVAIVVSSILWIDKRPYTWRLLHYLAYLALVAVFVHGLFLGTDLRGGTYRVLWFFGGISVLTAIVMRLWRAWTISKGK